ncbi:MAG: hypothetical protein ACPHJD_03335 [Poseidonia sp.]
MIDPTIALDILGASTPSPAKPSLTLGDFLVWLLIVAVIVGVLFLIGMGMLQSFIDGF